jgi:hypothetical protein
MGIDFRRDAFCGKMSVCNVLSQYGIPYTLTSEHTQRPDSKSFRADLRSFAAVCRVSRGLRSARIGAIGARPGAFKTVRYSEKILEASGIAVEPVDLFDIMGRVQKLADNDKDVRGKLDEIKAYVSTDGIPNDALVKMAKLGLVIDRWMREVDVTGQRRAVLDGDGGILRRRALHAHEHHEQRQHAERVRGRCVRDDQHVRAHAGVGDAERAAGLEQQLRRRSGQGGLLPLQQPAEGVFRRRRDGLPGDHRRDGRVARTPTAPSWEK